MININGQIYDGVMIKPELDDALEHYGVKGMKWRKRLKGKYYSTKSKVQESMAKFRRSLGPKFGVSYANHIIRDKNGKFVTEITRNSSGYHYSNPKTREGYSTSRADLSDKGMTNQGLQAGRIRAFHKGYKTGVQTGKLSDVKKKKK